MSTDRDINRRDLMVKTAGVASAGALAGASLTPALAAEPLPPGFDDQPPLRKTGTSRSTRSSISRPT